MNKLEKAIEFATEKHDGQKRDGGEPYITHPLAVLNMVSRLTDDENVRCAAVLHDVIEDTDATYEEIIEKFGLSVTLLVDELTNGNKTMLYSRDSKLIKLCDRLHNLSTMDSWSNKRQHDYLIKTQKLLKERYGVK